MTRAGVDPVLITDQAHFSKDLGLDSLDVIGLLLEVERYFTMRIPEEDWWQLNTVDQLIRYICQDQLFSECEPTLADLLIKEVAFRTGHNPF